MTREEAINKLIRIRQLQGGKSEAHEALGMAIDALAYQAELPEGLEEAAENYVDDWTTIHAYSIEQAFIAGAEWQRKQDQQLIELAEDHAMLAGMNKMKEEMMKAAVDGMVCATITGTNAISFLSPLPDELNAGDKVKVIFIKEDEI